MVSLFGCTISHLSAARDSSICASSRICLFQGGSNDLLRWTFHAFQTRAVPSDKGKLPLTENPCHLSTNHFKAQRCRRTGRRGWPSFSPAYTPFRYSQTGKIRCEDNIFGSYGKKLRQFVPYSPGESPKQQGWALPALDEPLQKKDPIKPPTDRPGELMTEEVELKLGDEVHGRQMEQGSRSPNRHSLRSTGASFFLSTPL
jgi:hypothetical protein